MKSAAALPSSSSSSYRRCENEASRRLHRCAVETSQRLEQNLSQISNFNKFFSPEITEVRTRLKDYCERLIFTDPVTYGKRAEELLWRKVYYEFFQKCRQNKKKLMESEFNRHTLRTHLLAAVGSYHHMLLRIQTEFHVDLNSKVDASFLWHIRGLKKERWKKYQQSNAGDSAIHSWALQSSHRILTYLGDLARYLSELQLKHRNTLLDDSHLAERYYLQAFCLNPKSGFPHNQLASLASNTFDSAYHYMRCLSSPDKFEGAENNLMRIFDKNHQTSCEAGTDSSSSENVQKYKQFLGKFLKLCEMFYFTSDENLQNICQEVLQEFDVCLVPDKPVTGESGNDENYQEPVCLDDERVFRIVVMCMMCISKLHEHGSSDVSTATAFALALFSSVIHQSIKRIHSSVCINFELQEILVEADLMNNEIPLGCDTKASEEIKNKMNQVNQIISGKKGSNRKAVSKLNTKRLRKMRRRRKMSSTSQEDSEISDGEGLELADGSDEENDILNSDVSQTGSCSSDTLSEHEDLTVETKYVENECKSASENFSVDVYINNVDNYPHEEELKKDDLNSTSNSLKISDQHLNGSSSSLLQPEKIAEVLIQSTFIGTLKIIVDWLRTHNELLKLCAESLRFLLSRLTVLLNLLLKLEEEVLKLGEDFSELKRNGSDWSQVIPLPEDVLLQHLPSLDSIQSNFDYDYSKRRYYSPIKVVFLRLQCILCFGDQFGNCPDALIFFDKEKNEFILKAIEVSKLKDKIADDSDSINNSDNNIMDNQRQQLMHEMAHLWLKSEVNHLERSVKNSASPQLSPLLVVDTSSLCHHLPLLKQLIGAKYFIVIVPKVVIDNLDHLKKKSLGAREAIRWLEYIFQKGSRHVRTQRDSERNNLHPMKYPKRKDKESWDYFQILECCSYLSQQQQQLKSSYSLVTFLVGSNNHLPGNAAALAKSLNITMENVESFFSKWRSSTKKPG